MRDLVRRAAGGVHGVHVGAPALLLLLLLSLARVAARAVAFVGVRARAVAVEGRDAGARGGSRADQARHAGRRHWRSNGGEESVAVSGAFFFF